ncbi:DUF2975 domain-containing protein [Altererythrobacter endophyticus]|uniref:DUF2975 domain-containing protein n=2 Tax=Altericroceibacterium endophyticum TaxID=1808508 RepID=A0A6I4T6J0_9SPHN|nr:DUF2975 domain-containing protein [Altericroceibacterium endophyticum]
MPSVTRDPLLGFARIILIFFTALFAFAGIAVLLGVPALLIFQSDILAELAADGKNVPTALIPGIALLLGFVALLMGLMVYFLLLLRRIVLSVGEGDPFIPENARRLSRMGWTALIGQLVTIPVGALGTWIARIAADSGRNADVDLSFPGGGLLLILTLFILARVFRQGAEMRDDLEGTV